MGSRYQLSKNAKAINPYTFIPIVPEDRANGEKEGRLGYYTNAEEYYQDKEHLLTGTLHCKIQVKTPLAMSNLKQSATYGGKQAGEHYYISRECIDGVIPGSSLRGMIRSIYETMTNSCFSTMRSNTILSKRENPDKAENVYEPAILKINENGEYELYKAVRHRIPIKNSSKKKENNSLFLVGMKNGIRCVQYSFAGKNYLGKTGDLVDFTLKTKDKPDKKDNEEENKEPKSGIVTEIKPGMGGILCIGENFPSKLNEGLFVKYKKIEVDSEIIKTAYDRLKQVQEMYQDSAVNKNLKTGNLQTQHSGYEAYNHIKSGDEIPLWYQLKNGNLHLSYAAIGRVSYNTTLNELAGKRCEDRKHVCEACLLFGMIGDTEQDKKNLGLGSRVRFSDARIVDSKAEISVVTVKELAKPHASYLPFYAEYEESNDVPKSYDKEELTDKKDKVKIRGRKFYWHNQSAKNHPEIYMVEKNSQTERNVTLHLVEPKTEFEFDIYYDGIRNDELKQLEKLIWAITLGENNFDSKLCHKLGQGKPLGLGSVKLIIDSQIVRTVDEFSYNIKTKEFNNELIKEPGDYLEIIQALKKVVNLEEPFIESEESSEISYPYLVNSEDERFSLMQLSKGNKNDRAAHKWFERNRKAKVGQKLPEVLEKDQRLQMYQYIED